VKVPVEESKFIPFHDLEVHETIQSSLHEIELVRCVMKDHLSRKLMDVNSVKREVDDWHEKYIRSKK
jgi:hypothetical protein